MQIAATLNPLRARLIAADLRSRSIRLARCTLAGAHDVAPLSALAPAQTARLLEQFGREDRGETDFLSLHAQDPNISAAAKQVMTLVRAAHATWQETGADELALGWPLIEARAIDGTWLRAPLLLAPVRIAKDERRPTLVASVNGPVELNEPFAKILARTFGATLDFEALLDGDLDRTLAIDPSTFFDLKTSLVRAGLPVDTRTQPNIESHALGTLEDIPPRTKADREAFPLGALCMHHAVVLGRFPRSGSQLVGDYDVMLQARTPNALGICRTLLTRLDDAGDLAQNIVRSSTTNVAADDVLGLRQWQVLASDKSQDEVFRALFAAEAGDDAPGVVVQGPPGTGKSQLLTNVIAAAVGAGKSTLVVCQKRAALDVVAQRLESVGLRESSVVVHDTSRDRATVADAVATRLAPLLDSNAVAVAVADDADALGHHGRATASYRARLTASQTAFAKLTTADGDRPPLLSLLEDDLVPEGATNDDRVVDLAVTMASVNRADVDVACIRATTLAPMASPLAAPHPLFWRRSFASLNPADRPPLFDAIDRAAQAVERFGRGEVDALATGGPSFTRLLTQRDAFAAAEDALESLDDTANPGNQEGANLRLFWAWTDGHDAAGDWMRVHQLLENAAATFVDVARELISAPEADLETWTVALEGGAAVEDKWTRMFTGAHWRSRRAINDVATRTHADPQTRAATLDHIVAARRWRQLIADLPDDNCFLEVGVTGSLADLSLAQQSLARDHARVAAIHALADGLKRALSTSPGDHRGALFSASPDVSVVDDPWTREALSAHRRLQRYHRAQAAIDAVAHAFDPHALADFREALATGDGDAFADALAAFAAARDDVDAAQALDQEMAEDPAFLVRFLRRYRGDDVTGDLVRSARRGWRQLALHGRDPALLTAPLTASDALLALQDAAQACRQAAGPAAAAALRQRVRQRAQGASTGPALRRLLAQCQKKRRRHSLRSLTLEGNSSGLMTLIPVWLCSPDAVAHLFDAAPEAFDIVIFDEASQCPVEAGLPALWRGARALIAGDDQQMPPSHFFSSRDDDEEADEDDDVVQSPSLLALARLAFPSISLAYHYRSLDDALIAFSNHAFYGGNLTTAPRPAGAIEEPVGFRWRPVGGQWIKQQNHTEAEAIVDEIDRSLRHAPHLSVGVVCLNRPQADLVEERIERRALADPAFAARLQADALRPPVEQLFVRNLENVQGDERDVILFSIGYGRGEDGKKFRARLGPLSQRGGEKRLNVAITRAKRLIVVVTSFAPEELDVATATHPGPKLFRLWLQYARACAKQEATAAILASAVSVVGAPLPRADAVRHRDILGARLLATMAAEFSDHQSGWTQGAGLGREKIDFARGNEALDVTALWREADAISRDVTGPAFWARAGYCCTRVTPAQWQAQAHVWTTPPPR